MSSQRSGEGKNDNRVERDGNAIDYLLIGGIIIMYNPCDIDYINHPCLGEHIHHGFYDDMQVDGLEDMNMDDLADCAEADVDFIGDPNIAEYAAEFDADGDNLGLNEDLADIQQYPVADIEYGGKYSIIFKTSYFTPH
jgi:hypothetical protein